MMELDGTNTYVLKAPGSDECVVVDPGPPKYKHHARRLAELPVALTLVTHRHFDHTGGISRLHKRTGTPVRARLEKHCRKAAPLRDREVIEIAGLRITVLDTPGTPGGTRSASSSNTRGGSGPS